MECRENDTKLFETDAKSPPRNKRRCVERDAYNISPFKKFDKENSNPNVIKNAKSVLDGYFKMNKMYVEPEKKVKAEFEAPV